MKIAFINAVPYGSTGNIVKQLLYKSEKQGDEVIAFFSWSKKKHRFYRENVYNGCLFEKIIHIVGSKITGCIGCFSIFDTLNMIHRMEQFKPDIIHLNLLHAWSFNIPLLFKYIKKREIPIVWTMHDCWAFTGHCPHFTIANCDKWKRGCYECAYYKEYPASFIDASEYMWKLKKKYFTLTDNITIVTPSMWLKNVVKESFFKQYKTIVINNGIDLKIFHYRKSDVRKRFNIDKNKKIVLGVAFDWSYKKGIDICLQLSQMLDESKYQVMLVGIEHEKMHEIPDSIIAIEKTQNQVELAEIYSAADIFINPTREEVLGLVNIEALACGTPVVTFNSGGSPECINDSCGIVVKNNDLQGMYDAVIQIDQRKISKEDCVYSKYIELFHNISGK